MPTPCPAFATLNALFHSLTGWALNHLKEGGNAAYFEMHMRLAFKAQRQSRVRRL